MTSKELESTIHDETAVSPASSSVDSDVEKSARRKIDLRLMPILTLVYLFAFIDRANAGNARVLGMAEDLKLDADRFNIALTCFYVPYIIFEVPANIMCKMLGPKIWIPTLTLCFGVIVISMSRVSTYEGFLVARFFLGLAEAGIMPGITYSLSCFYRRAELVSRVGLYASVASLSGAFGGLLATGFARVPAWGPSGELHTWRNIFFFEGFISVIIAIAAFIILPTSPAKASFLTDEEKRAVEAGIAEDLGSQQIETLKARYVKRAILNKNTALLAVASLCSLLTMNSMALFVPSILVTLGYSGIEAQLMSVPPYVLGAAVCVTVTLLSDRTRKRGIFILGVMPLTAIGFIILVTVTNTKVLYFALFLAVTGAFTASPMFVAWVVDNTAGHMTRAIAAGAVVGFGNIGGLIAAWTYTLPDAPRYIQGHAVNLGAACVCMLTVVAAIYTLHRENRARAKGKRDYRIEGSNESLAQDLGHDHPRFVFAL